jgi:hypothetical protein
MEATPTPFPTPDATPMNLGVEGLHVYMVQGYNFVNMQGFFDYIFLFLIILMVAASIWLVVKAVKDV